jgi:hypothetical protein
MAQTVQVVLTGIVIGLLTVLHPEMGKNMIKGA